MIDTEAKELITEIWEKRHPEEAFFMSIFKDLKSVEDNKGNAYFMNKDVIFIKQDMKNMIFWISYTHIWSALEHKFKLSRNTLTNMLKEWLHRELNCKDYTLSVPFNIRIG